MSWSLECFLCKTDNEHAGMIIFAGSNRIICDQCTRGLYQRMQNLSGCSESDQELKCFLCESDFPNVKCLGEGETAICVFCVQQCWEILHEQEEPADPQPEHVGNGIYYTRGQRLVCTVKGTFNIPKDETEPNLKRYEVLIAEDDLPAILFTDREMQVGDQQSVEFSGFWDGAIWVEVPLRDRIRESLEGKIEP